MHKQNDFIIEMVAALEDAGVVCFPVKPDKRPIKPWGELTQRPREFREELIQSQLRNKRPILIAAIPGKRCCVVDIDNPEAYGKSIPQDNPPDLGAAMYITPSGGRQAWFATPADYDISGVVHLGWGELRTGDGCYCIIPPGRAEYNKGGKHIRGAYSVPEGCEWLHETIDHLLTLPQYFSDMAREKLSNKRRAETSGEVVLQEGGRDIGLMSLAGSMRDRGFTEAAILAALAEQNRTSVIPPLEPTAIERIARSVGRYMPTDPPPAIQDAVEKPVQPDDDRLISDAKLSAISIPPPTVLWGTPNAPLLVAREPHLLHAREGMGKSWLAMGLAYEIATGGPSFVGVPLDGKTHTVLLMSYELSRYAAQQRLRRIHDGRKPADNLYLVCEEHLAGQLDLMDPATVAWMESRIGELKPELIIIDPLAQAAKCDESNKEFAILVERLAQLRLATGAALLLLHHERKGPPEGVRSDTDDLDAMRGGTVLRAGMRIVMRMVQRDDDYTEFTQTKSNLGDKWPKTILDMSLPWCPILRPERTSKAEERQNRAQRLHAYISAAAAEGRDKGALTDWGEGEGIAWRTVHEVIKKLKAQGYILLVGSGKKFRYIASEKDPAGLYDE